MKKLVLAMVAMSIAVPAFSQMGDESGVTKKYRGSFGFYTAGSTDSFDNFVINAAGVNKTDFTFKIDMVTSRPTRHETLISYQYFNNVLEIGSGSILSAEYRWRFDKFGRAYYGVNMGIWKLHTSGSEAKSVSGSALGYHTGPDSFIELRYSLLSTNADFTSIMVGKRF